MKNLKTVILLSTIIVISCHNAQAQDGPEHRMSPIVIEQTTVDDAYMKVVYGQPYKRNRDIFGELVPYGEVWRAGANEATEFTLTSDIKFGGEDLKAGTYSLFAIPNEGSWTMIVSSQLGQWGAFDYDEGKDVFRFNVPVKKNDEVSEAFTIKFAEDGSALNLMWDNTAVSVPVSVD
ncbi:MAG: DUF2911 domain-containing protein [Balneolales bacterium]